MPIVETQRLRREFQAKKKVITALEDIDLQVEESVVFGLLGPNGAGKTTLIRILSTLLLPTSGKATVAGFDVAKEPEKIRPLINMASGAERAGYDFITARGNLWFFSQLYGVDSSVANRSIETLSAALRLENYLDSKLYTLSTGYRQRLTIARSLINDPRVVFLDEPTIGLDVMTAKSIREFLVSQAKDQKRTIFIATHNMAETEAICDRVAIIDSGRIVACDSPASLKKNFGAPATVMEVSPPLQSLQAISSVRGVKGATSAIDADRGVARLKLIVDDEGAVKAVGAIVESSGSKVLQSWMQEPSLEEVFISLIGRGFAERESEDAN